MSDLFNNWIYEKSADNSARFVLGERGGNPLVCIGVNPSTAEPNKLDSTLRRVKAFSQNLGYDGWIMLNLYPQRATNPKNLHNECDHFLRRENEKWLYRYLGSAYIHQRTIWAAWGALIEKRGYLTGCLRGIIETGSIIQHKWITIGKRTQAGHPRHPLYLPADAEVQQFDVSEYLRIREEI